MVSVTARKVRDHSGERSSVGVGRLYTGYLISYPIIGRGMVIFRDPHGHRMITTPVKRVLGEPEGQMIYVETENSVYRLEIHGEPIFPMAKPGSDEAASGSASSPADRSIPDRRSHPGDPGRRSRAREPRLRPSRVAPFRAAESWITCCSAHGATEGVLMKQATLDIRFWGVRGSVPSPGPATAGVGGNTSCVEIRAGDQVIVLDAGTGLRGLGDRLLAERGGAPVRASILFSHVHWDHIQGFPFFAPVFCSGTELDLHGAPENGSLEQALTHQMTGPTFPVRFADVPSDVRCHALPSSGPFAVGDVEVTAARLHHPNGVFAYRLEFGGRSIVYATDTEHYPDRIDRDLVALAAGADVLIYDAMYTPEQYESRRGWGHSTWVEGVRVGRAAGVGQLVLFHHDPIHDDAEVAAIERAAAEELSGTIAAREGLVLSLPTRHRLEEAA
jgi:phosphoribosyl 1,2-cyclic phosphodiesterase